MKKLIYIVPVELTKNNLNLELFPKEVDKLGHLIYHSILDNLPSLKLLNKYLIKQ